MTIIFSGMVIMGVGNYPSIVGNPRKTRQGDPLPGRSYPQPGMVSRAPTELPATGHGVALASLAQVAYTIIGTAISAHTAFMII